MAITRAYDVAGMLLHSCAEGWCAVSWDGYVLADGYTVDAYDADGNLTRSTPLAQGERVPGATDPDPNRWDTSTPGVARRIG